MNTLEPNNLKNLDFLNNLTIAFNYCRNVDEINQILGEKIRELLPNAFITITSANESRQYARISKIFGFEKTLATIKSFLKSDPFKIKLPLKDLKLKQLEDFTSGKLFEEKEGIYYIMTEKIPKPICKAIEKILGIKKIYVMGQSESGVLYGAVTIMTHTDVDDNTKAIIENIIRHSTIIIRKKIIEKNLKESEIKYKTVVENIKLGLVLVDYEGEILFLNNFNAGLINKTPEEIIGKNISNIFSGEDAEEFMENVRKAIDENKKFEREKKITYNYSNLWLSSIFQPFYDNITEKTIAMVITRDGTEIKRMGEELQSIKMTVSESEKIKTSFLANFSHEVRSLMNGVTGFAQLIKESDSIAEAHEYSDIIILNGNNLLKIFNDIIDIAKIEAGTINVDRQEFSINHVLSEIYDIFKIHPKIQSKNIELKEVKNSKDIIIITDRTKMKHIFINLVDNAIKFCNKGSVEFGYNIKNNKEIECFVKDTGIGLSKENQSKIFRRFFQAEDINTRNYNGAGIGLSLVKGYIDALKGKIWVESETGKGSTFFFLIP